ncbi:MAG: four helix bundle protein [Bacteroidales bacterium]|nr:four helix bundle protein [Bacteroidales bacterium]
MALYSELPVYSKTYQLLCDVMRQTPNVRREYRYTMCQDLTRLLTDMLVNIYEANRTREKLDAIEELRRNVVKVKIYLRAMVDLRLTSEGWYVQEAEKAEDVSRQLALWEKYLRGKKQTM